MFILNQKIIIGGERWFTPMKDLKPVDGLKLLVASSDNDQYRSRNALIRRHIEKMDASLHVGTKEFDISKVSEVDSVDDLLIDNAARYLLKDWKGVGELVNGVEVALEYTAERGIALLKQNPELYWQILAEAGYDKKAIAAQRWLSEFGGERGEKARWKREKLRLPPIPEPEIDPVLKELLYAYSVISRARRYAGMAGVPLPLSLTEINEYLATHPVLIERDEFEAVIFALDDQYFQEQCV
ncbi:hypothetical protein NB16F79_39920 [Escherichia coli]